VAAAILPAASIEDGTLPGATIGFLTTVFPTAALDAVPLLIVVQRMLLFVVFVENISCIASSPPRCECKIVIIVATHVHTDTRRTPMHGWELT